MTTRTAQAVTVVQTGPLCTIQDLGRPGLGSWGIGRSGAADRASYLLANRLLGNDPDRAALEVTLGGLVLRADRDIMVALTGARCPDTPHNAVVQLAAGQTLELAAPAAGVRTYVGVRGGFQPPETLGSRATDVLAGLGPQPVEAGDALAVGRPPAKFPTVDVAPRLDPPDDTVRVRMGPGPRRDWFGDDAWELLSTEPFTATGDSDRIGMRLEGPVLERVRDDELPSEGMGRGAIQVPPSGQPVLFLADHPVTGGYPVIGYVVDDDVDACAQLRPGQSIRFRRARGGMLRRFREGDAGE